MNEYKPDRWVMVKTSFEGSEYYKVLGSWYGGFGGSNSWKLSSGTVRADLDARRGFYSFPQVSKSLYVCHKESYGTSGYTQSVFDHWVEKLEEKGSGKALIIMPEDTDFLNLDYK